MTDEHLQLLFESVNFKIDMLTRMIKDKFLNVDEKLEELLNDLTAPTARIEIKDLPPRDRSFPFVVKEKDGA